MKRFAKLRGLVGEGQSGGVYETSSSRWSWKPAPTPASVAGAEPRPLVDSFAKAVALMEPGVRGLANETLEMLLLNADCRLLTTVSVQLSRRSPAEAILAVLTEAQTGGELRAVVVSHFIPIEGYQSRRPSLTEIHQLGGHCRALQIYLLDYILWSDRGPRSTLGPRVRKSHPGGGGITITDGAGI